MAAKIVSVEREAVQKRMMEVAYALANAGIEPDLTTVAAMTMLVENLKTSHHVVAVDVDETAMHLSPASKLSH